VKLAQTVSIVTAALCCAAQAAGAQERNADTNYVETDTMIAMRDGVRLFTVILTPKQMPEPLPMLLDRTPYGAADFAHRMNPVARFGLEGYILAFQDIRGRFGSEGSFAMNRPPRSGHAGTDESSDTYDTIDWLVKHVANNSGKVGVYGISYPGWLTAVAGIGAHPALKAISPQAPMGDTWMGDDFFHQGAFRQSYGLEYTWEMESSDTNTTPSLGRYDTYDWYLSFPTLGDLARAVKADRWPTWRRFVEHPAYDSAWQARSLPRYFTHTTVPSLMVGGWWDQEDEFGPLATYAVLEQTDTSDLSSIVMGPWYHGQWFVDSGTALGDVHFDRATGRDFRELEAKWFAYWLKGIGTKPAEATVFDAGTNEWKTFDQWPPKGVTERHVYLGENGSLSFDPPPATPATTNDRFVSDPAHPVPYRPRPVERTYSPGSRWRRWETEDQRFVQGRPDVLTWQSAPLTNRVTIAGDVVAHLYAATTGSDADWVVKLIDVYPDTIAERPKMGGYQLMVTGEIMRGRYRLSWEHPAAIKRDSVLPYTVHLHQQAYTFKPGHRIMVQVQSTWFPLYDRNPQTFVPNIFRAQASDYKAQTHRIYRTAKYPSNVEIDVLP